MSEFRAQIIRAGTGWCAFSHQHDNSKAALNAAITALQCALEAERSQEAVYAFEVLETIEDLIGQLGAVSVPLSEALGSVPSAAQKSHSQFGDTAMDAAGKVLELPAGREEEIA